MDDEVAMRIGDGVAGLQEQVEHTAQVQAGAIFIDRRALDVLHHKIWLAIGAAAGVQQARNAGVIEGSEDAPLAQKTRAKCRRTRSGPYKLDGNALLHF